jgi:HEAT repeat protein
MGFFRNFELDKGPFWIGFIAGALFWWLASTLRTHLPDIIKFIKQQAQTTREGLTASTESRYRNDLFKLAQSLHIASPIFALDEIVITPKLIAPPASISSGDNGGTPEEIFDFTFPYIPDWPILASTYNSSHLTIIEALQGGANLVLIGDAGSGKTVTLAYIISAILQRNVSIERYSHLLPVYVNAHDIETPKNYLSEETTDEEGVSESTISLESSSSIDILISAVSNYVSPLTLPRLPTLIKSVFESDRVFLLLDGLDELATDQYVNVITYLSHLFSDYPSIRVITTATLENFSGLTALGLIPVAMSSWGDQDRENFIHLWGSQWNKYVIQDEEESSVSVDPLLLNYWLTTRDSPQSPLEVTLKIWAAYAGDIIGTDLPDSLEAYIRRMSIDVPNARSAMERLALQMILTHSPAAAQNDAEDWISEFYQPKVDPETELENGTDTSEDIPTDASIDEIKQDEEKIKAYSVLPELISNGLLITHGKGRLSFANPILLGYLAGSSLSYAGNIISLSDEPEWIGRDLALFFLAYFGDVSSYVEQALVQEDFLRKPQLQVGRWMKVTNQDQAWRLSVLKYLANALQKETLTLGASGRIMSALASSGDSGINTLFRQMTKSEHPNLRQMAALGCGMIRDSKSINELAALTNDTDSNVGKAACFALVAIGNKSALETVATALLQGDELIRRSAAEALANHIEEGHPALKDGSKMPDLMVRRSVVFGLKRVNEAWAEEILEIMSLEDGQWIVRNAAIQTIEELRAPNTSIPQPYLSLEDTPWLIAYAGKLGVGISPGQQAVDLVMQALKDGDDEERLAALDYFKLYGTQEEVLPIYDIYLGSLGELREAAYNTLWHLAAEGYRIPTSEQLFIPDTQENNE